MGKFNKIVSLLMSGYTDSAADAFVDNAFRKVTGILTEARHLTPEDKRVLDGLGTNDIEDLNVMFDNNVNPYGGGGPGSYWKDAEKLQQTLSRIGINIPSDEFVDEYLDEVWEEIEYQVEVRQEADDEQMYGDDLRDYDEEDRQSAWNDRYQAFKNEY